MQVDVWSANMGVNWILGVSKREIRDNGDIRKNEAERQGTCLDEEIKEENSKVITGRGKQSTLCSWAEYFFSVPMDRVILLSDWWGRHQAHKA